MFVTCTILIVMYNLLLLTVYTVIVRRVMSYVCVSLFSYCRMY